MHPLMILLHLAAAVVLLLYAVRMVRTGLERAHGAVLRDRLQAAAQNRLGAAGGGLVLAMLLQSATAVGVLVASFAAGGMLPAVAGVAALLGADLGSALVVRLLVLDLSALVPVLILAGGLMVLKSTSRRLRQYGRIALGIAFVLVSLQMIGAATEPLRQAPGLPAVMGWLARDPLTAFAAAAVLAWGLHSSVALVLILAALAQGGALPAAAVLPLLMGANAGGAPIAVWLTRGMEPSARRLPLANLILRGAAALAVALGAGWLAPGGLPAWLGESPGVALVNAHVAFNAAVLVLALPLTGAALRLAALMVPDRPLPLVAGQRRPSALDRTTLAMPAMALASAKQELLLMGAALEEMLRPVPALLHEAPPEQADLMIALDDEINRRHSDVKLFLAALAEADLTADEVRQSIELTGLAISLEHAGDIVAKTLLPLARKKTEEGRHFSAAGAAELAQMQARVLGNLHLAMNVLVSGDVEAARRLMREKEAMRALERASIDAHLARLRAGQGESLATSAWHLESVRAFKEINSLLVGVALPILEGRGEVLRSRLSGEAEGVSPSSPAGAGSSGDTAPR